jgi:hypothetical protein
MAHPKFNEEGFLTTLGREFAAVTNELGDFKACGQDCCSAIVDVILPPLRPESLDNLTRSQLSALAASLNDYFDTDRITARQMERAVAATLWHWPAESR